MSLYSRLDRLAADVEKLNRQITSVANHPQSQRTSVEGGSIDFNDDDGNLMAIVGSQDDGGNTINVLAGPTPPTPTGFTVDVDHGKFILHWFGDFDGDALAPSDWSRAEVHASQDPFFVPSRTTARGSIVSAAGGEVTIGVLKGPWTIKMVSWSQAGKMSVPSAPLDVEVPGYGDIVLEEIDAAQTRIDNARAILIEGQETLGEKLDKSDTALASLRDSLDNLDETTLPALRQDLDAAEGRLESAEGQITDAFGQLDAVPGQISAAKQAAEAKAATAQAKADVANDKASALFSAGASLIMNGDFENPSLNIWPNTSAQGGIEILEVSHARSGTHVMRLNATTGNRYPLTEWVESAEGRIYYAEVWVYLVDTDMTKRGRVSFYSQCRLEDGTEPGAYGRNIEDTAYVYVYQDQMVQGQWNKVSAYVTTRPNTTHFRVSPHSLNNETPYDFDDFKVVDVTESMGALREAWAASTEAEAAHTAAGSAQTAADAAMTTANGLSKVLHGTTAPTGVAPDGSIWWQHKTNLSGPVIGQWNRVSGAWQSTPVSSEAIANLDAGKLTAGTAAIAEAVVQKIAAQTASIQTADIKNLFVTGTASLSNVVAERIAAETAEFIELEVGNLVAGTGTMDEATINKLFADVVVAGMSIAEEFIGENAILTGAVTAPKITASEELWAKLAQFVTVYAEMVDADVFRGRRFEGVDIAASRFTAGTGVEITEDYGIRQFGPNGELNVSFPSDGSPATFAGDVRAKSLTATGRMAIEGPAVVASGGQIQLESGVTPPATPPNVSSYVKRTPFPPLAANENAVGLAFDGTHFWRAVDVGGEAGTDRLERIDSAGVLVSSFTVNFWMKNGITIIGTEIFALGIEDGPNKDKSKRFVYVYDFAGTFLRKWEYTNYGTGIYQPGIGTNGTDIIIAQCWKTGELTWRRYNKTTGATLATIDSTHRFSGDIVGAEIGSFDYGAPVAVITKGNNAGSVEVYNSSSGALVSAGGWENATGSIVRATVWDGARFHHLTPDGNVSALSTTKYPNGAAGPETNDWWAGCTWRNGSSETTMGPVKRFTMKRRVGITVSTGQKPSSVSTVRVYVARKATEPTRADFLRVGEVSAGENLVIRDFVTGAGSPPASNSFPNSTPGLIRSTLGGFEVKGDGSGKWGPLEFHADGTMTSTAVPAWIPITSFATGFSIASFGFAPAYRVWPDGKVEWRGVVNGNFTGVAAATPFVVPSAARPLYPVNTVAACNITTGGTEGHVRIEFCAADRPTQLSAYAAGKARTWFSLDGIDYYLS